MSSEKPVHIPRDTYPATLYPEVIPAKTEYVDDEISLLDYWQVLVARRWTLFAVLATVLATTTIYMLQQVPIYEAETTIQIDRENPNILSFEDVYQVETSSDDTLRTQFEILKSRSLARRVIEDLNLDKHVEFQPGSPTVLSSISKTIKDIFSSVSSTNTKEDESDPLRPVVDAYIDRLSVSPVRLARLVTVRFEAKDPELAAQIINSHAKHFINQNLQFKVEATQMASDFLNDNLVTLRSTLEKSEDRLQEYSRRNGILFTEDGLNTAAEKLRELEVQYTQAQVERFQKESYERLVRTGSSEALPQITNSQNLGVLTAKLADLKRQESELSVTFGPGYPLRSRLTSQIAQIAESIESEKAAIVKTVQAEHMAAIERERLIGLELGKQRDLVHNINQEIIQYNILKREVESNRQLHDGLLTRLKEAGVSAGLKASNIRVVDRAEIPEFPVRPRRALGILIGLGVGLVLGVGCAFGQEYLDRSLKGPEDVTRYLRLPTLGMIPKLESLTGKGSYGKAYSYISTSNAAALSSKHVAVDRIAHDAPLSLMSEAYRSLRTSFLLSRPGHPPQKIVVTSAAPSEGKTVTAINLAISLTQTGSKVVLIDADMRRPRVHTVFSCDNSVGLSAFLAGTANLKDVIKKTDVPGLLLIPCGITPPNPGELVMSSRFKQMLTVLQEYFDFVVLDSPPLGNVSDSRILATNADSTILVVKSFSTSRHQARTAVQHLAHAQAHLAGVVLNDVDVRTRSYYSGSSYMDTYYSGTKTSTPVASGE